VNEHSNYWTRRARTSRFTRRRFVGGAAATGVGAAAFGLVGCGDDDDEGSDATATSTGTSSNGTGTATATSTGTAASEKQKGGRARFTSAGNTWDTFDSDRSRFGPMGAVLGLTQMGVVKWENYENSVISGEFAGTYEQPDDLTFTFTVADNLVWQDKPPVNGRAANAEDIVHHIERNKAGTLKDGTPDANFYRQPLFAVVEKAEAVDDKNVKVTMSRPWPFFLLTLAQTWTKVQSPEAVDAFEADFAQFNVDHMIGTGHFVLTKFNAEGSLSFDKFDKAIVDANWDGIDYINLFTDVAAQQAAFEQKQIDGFGFNAPPSVIADVVSRHKDEVHTIKNFIGNPIVGTFYGGAPPWQDQNLIGAIIQTLDRRGLLQQIYSGNGAIAGFPLPAWAPYALPESELIKYPGYLEDRDKDHTDARARWDAAGGSGLGEIIVDIPDIFEGSYAGIGSVITNHLKSVLGNDFTPVLQPYATITAKLVGQQYGNGANNVWWGWGNPHGDPDPTLDIINAFESTSSQYQQWAVDMPKMDGIIAKMKGEFDVEERIKLNHEASVELITHAGGGITPICQGIAEGIYWNYFQHGEITMFVTYPNWANDLWFDQKDPSWQGRG
jgi:ABC-type transport system substrate-binding protein